MRGNAGGDGVGFPMGGEPHRSTDARGRGESCESCESWMVTAIIALRLLCER